MISHRREHVIEDSRILERFDTRYAAFMSEAVAMAYFKQHRSVFKNVLKRGTGFERESLNDTCNNLYVYIFLTNAPFEKRLSGGRAKESLYYVSFTEEPEDSV